MTGTILKTPFSLGAFLDNPDAWNAANQALFQTNYDSFTQLMGVAPQFFDGSVDYRLPVSGWSGSASGQAQSMARSVSAKTMTPVIALPMFSIAAGSMTPDQQFQAFINGQYDINIKNVVDAWVQQGFTTQIYRLGWEMNVPGTPTYIGGDAQTQADWVKAFQHIYTVLHQEAQANGVKLQVMWNPGTTNYSAAEATTNLYPGNNYVDIIGADIYSDIYPYQDSSSPATYHDWATGGEDTSVAQFIANPVNRVHYWNNPAANQWTNDGSQGHSLSLAALIAFAQQQGKEFAIAETGAGNLGVDVSDDPAFPQWLASQLTAAQAAGLKIDFVNLWDSNNGGTYQFSNASDNKPLAAAAWAKYFGGQPVTAAPAAITIGSGHDAVVLMIAEDAWQGDAQYTVSVDGVQIGGTQTETASYAAGLGQQVTVAGDWGFGTHSVAVNFLNDAYGGSASADRNLYVVGASYHGYTNAVDTLNLLSNGSQTLTVGGGVPGITKIGSGSDVVALQLNEDYYQGHTQVTVSVDGSQVGGAQTVLASHAMGQSQTFDFLGNWGSGTHTVSVDYLNDAYGGNSVADRNLYVIGASYDGHVSPINEAFLSQGTQTSTVVSATTYNPGSAGATITTLGVDTVNVGSGAVTVNAKGPSTSVIGGPGALTFFGSSGVDSITAGAGSVAVTGNADTLNFTIGTGSATITAGGNKELYNVINGHAGNTLTINNFVNGTDTIHLSGYTGNGMSAEQVLNGSMHITLLDNTRITLVGVTGSGTGIFS